MTPRRFDVNAPPVIGQGVRINTGQFEGYVGTVTRIDGGGPEVHLTIAVFGRPVDLRLDFNTAAEILDELPASPAGSATEPDGGAR